MWQDLEQIVEKQKSCCLMSIVGGQGAVQDFVGRKWFWDKETSRIIGDFPSRLWGEETIKALGQQAVRAEILELETEFFGSPTANLFVQPLSPQPTLFVLGAGHIAFSLAELGSLMGFKVVIVDDRPDFANSTRFPKAEEVICTDFASTLHQFPLTKQTYVVIVTRGHKYDQMCAEMVLGSAAAYIGMVGSKRRVHALKTVLIDQDFSEALLEKLYSPIGLDIGAETPAEIALSIMAEVVKVRRMGQRRIEGKKGELEIDHSVITALANFERCGSSELPFVLATIIEVKGSAPRKPGAQMLAFADGRTIGTVGGGCAEAEIRRAALTTLDRGIPMTYEVDLTNDIAAEDGMACGGTMKAFLQEINL